MILWLQCQPLCNNGVKQVNNEQRWSNCHCKLYSVVFGRFHTTKEGHTSDTIPKYSFLFLKKGLLPKKEPQPPYLLQLQKKPEEKHLSPKTPTKLPASSAPPSPGVVECHEWRPAVDLSKHQNLDLQAMPGFATASPRNLGGSHGRINPLLGGSPRSVGG